MTARNPEANCGNCVFGLENETDPLTVDCHRFPPVFIGTATHDDGDDYDHFRHPSHKTTSFCGEHPEFYKESKP